LAQLAFYSFKIIFSDAHFFTQETLIRLLDFFTTALTIIIVAVPEGLPLAVSISMAFSIDTMKNDHLLVKKI
jgi:magnesium-transporting ATPase (P-type)